MISGATCGTPCRTPLAVLDRSVTAIVSQPLVACGPRCGTGVPRFPYLSSGQVGNTGRSVSTPLSGRIGSGDAFRRRHPDSWRARTSCTPSPSEGVRAKAIAAFRRALPRIHRALAVRPRRHGRPDGRCDVSPRGGAPGFVSVLDDTRLAHSRRQRQQPARHAPQHRRQTGQYRPALPDSRAWPRRCASTGAPASRRDPELLAAHVTTGQAAEGRDRRRSRRGVPALRQGLHPLARCGTRPPGPTRDGLARPAQIWKDHIGHARAARRASRTWLADDYANNLY